MACLASMTLIAGILMVVLAVGSFAYSLPRGGQHARFVGTQWEGYVVVGMIAVTGAGLIMVVSAMVELFK